MAKQTLSIWLILLVSIGAVRAHAAAINEVLQNWIAHQSNITSWSATFTQTRSLKSLTQPLVSTGLVYFAAPRDFRWELGNNNTIAIRHDDVMVVSYPKVKRAEKYDFTGTSNNQWKDSLSLLQAGFPQSRAELDNQFKVIELISNSQLHQLWLEPKSAQARKMMPRLGITLDTSSHTLLGTELVFADGSSMKNIFTNVQTNIALNTNLFSVKVPTDFKVVEPLRTAR